MNKFNLIAVVLITAGTLSGSSSKESERPTLGCKAGNLLSERDPSLIADMGRFLADLKSAVTKGDKRRVASMVNYPLSVASEKAEFTVRSQEDFVNKYGDILSAPVRELLLRQEASCISRVGAKGFTIGSGEVWFNRFADGKIKIFSVNAVVYADELSK